MKHDILRRDHALFFSTWVAHGDGPFVLLLANQGYINDKENEKQKADGKVLGELFHLLFWGWTIAHML